MRTTFLMLLLALSLSIQAADRYRVLIPVYLEEPAAGAFGSLWTTPLAIYNGTSSTFQFDPACLEVCRDHAPLTPGKTQQQIETFTWEWRSGQPTRVLGLTTIAGKDSPAALSFQLRAADISRSATNAGTEVPVVRETEFRTSTVHLLNVPVDPQFRLTLRIYEMNAAESDFAVRIYDQAANLLLGSSMVHLTMPIAPNLPHLNGVPVAPAYLQIGDLAALIPAGAALPQMLRVEIEPKTSGSAFWGFISITNNQTQHVTLVTPQ